MKLAATQIWAGYGTHEVLQGVDVTLCAGEFVGLLGPNGCGKSTLLRVLSHALPPKRGEVVLDGSDIAKRTARERAQRLAFVPQSEPTHFDFTVRDVILMGRYPHRTRGGLSEEDFEIAQRAMQTADIAHLAERPITELSGGEHRRTLFARALAQDTPLLLLDEPTAHLDIAHQAEIMEKTRQLTREGRGALAALHDLNQAAEFCDRLILLHAGRILAQGTPIETLTVENLRIAYQIEAILEPNAHTHSPMIVSAKPLRKG